ncbi:MAG: hypothetical protein AB7E72_15335 [Lysobacterales bacterium]
MLTGVNPALLEFCQPWLAGEPRLLLACQFAPEGRAREQFLAVNVLMRELAQSVIAVSERRVAEARLAWWAEEAQAWAAGHPRHPLAHGFADLGQDQPVAGLVAVSADWLMAAAPEQSQALHARLAALAAASERLHPGATAWRIPWLALMLRLTLGASTPLTNVLPLDLWARHSLKRSQWPELAHARRCELMAEVVQGLALEPATAADPAMAVLQYLEARWLANAQRWRAEGDRLGPWDVLGAWRAARRSR